MTTFTKVEHTPEGHATPLFGVYVDEGWRSYMLCQGMYEWAAEWLVHHLQGAPAPTRDRTTT